ncbi:MAG: substrate-binding domain-containing protein, partial [Rikenellaceae bacterium]|nr:substrate-binding domain-containing protein [Rikenellaceae bacterium]
IKYLTYQNDSVSLLPYFAVEHKVRLGELKILNVDELNFQEEVGILTRTGEESPVIRSFLYFAENYNI